LDILYSPHHLHTSNKSRSGLVLAQHQRNRFPTTSGRSAGQVGATRLDSTLDSHFVCPNDSESGQTNEFGGHLKVSTKCPKILPLARAGLMYSMRDDGFIHIGVPVPCVEFAERQETSCCMVAYGTYRWLSLVARCLDCICAQRTSPVRALTLHSYAHRHSQSAAMSRN
jgi:hypothetical protein